MKHHQIIGFLMISANFIRAEHPDNRLLWWSEAWRLLVVKWRRAGNIWSPSTLFSTKLRLMASTCSTKLHVYDCTANLFEMWLWIICEQSGMWVASCHAGYAVWLNETRKSARGRLKSVNQIIYIYIYRNGRLVTSAYQRIALTEGCYCSQSELQREFAQDSHASAFVELKDAAPRRHCQMGIRWELLKDIERLIIVYYCSFLLKRGNVLRVSQGRRNKTVQPRPRGSRANLQARASGTYLLKRTPCS